ncbi:MAG: glycogen synthase GlgA [Clostridiales bacterium]|nr:glycogen synthase GlgA [Clostridiales bacterium]
MKVLFAASECVPFVKTGGLADVVGSLPIALKKEGVDVRVILPKYRVIDYYWVSRMTHIGHFSVLMGSQQVYCGIDSVEDNGITYYFVDNLAVFGGEEIYTGQEQDGFRFAFFCRAVLESLSRIDFFPDVLHCHDWQTGLIPVLLHEQYAWDERYQKIKTVYSIHNLRYQGLYTWQRMGPILGLNEGYFSPDNLEFYGLVSFMKAGIVFASHVSTVSPAYAQEIRTEYFGERMDGVLRKRQDVLSGILNGIDNTIFNPRDDRFLNVHFNAKSFENKLVLKRQLQEECGLEQRDTPPVISMITRLTPQKGLDLVEHVLDDILRMDVQLLVLGKGDAHYEMLFARAQGRYPGRLALRCELNEGMAHRIYAGSDMFLMPSQFEPCGLSQMIALRYGTVPIVRETGGLKDSIVPYNAFDNTGNGFSFSNYNAHEMLQTIERAVAVYYDDKEAWKRLMRRAMACDYSWDASARTYRQLYETLLGIVPEEPAPPKPKKKPAPPAKKPEPETKPAAKPKAATPPAEKKTPAAAKPKPAGEKPKPAAKETKK